MAVIRALKTDPLYEEAYRAFWKNQITFEQLSKVADALHRDRACRAIPRAKRYLTIVKQRLTSGVIDDIALEAAAELVVELRKAATAQRSLPRRASR